jgi:hypothetical protein
MSTMAAMISRWRASSFITEGYIMLRSNWIKILQLRVLRANGPQAEEASSGSGRMDVAIFRPVLRFRVPQFVCGLARACVISLLRDRAGWVANGRWCCRRRRRPTAAMEMAADLKGLAAGVFTKRAMHTPVAVTEEAIEHARSVDADCLVALGGGQPRGWARPSPTDRSSADRHPDHLCRQRGDGDSGPDREWRKNHRHRPENPAGSHSLRCRTGAHVACRR